MMPAEDVATTVTAAGAAQLSRKMKASMLGSKGFYSCRVRELQDEVWEAFRSLLRMDTETFDALQELVEDKISVECMLPSANFCKRTFFFSSAATCLYTSIKTLLHQRNAVIGYDVLGHRRKNEHVHFGKLSRQARIVVVL
jgi:hypothetical protein